MASRPYLLNENSMSFLWRNDLRLKTFLFMDYSMPSSWMEGVYYFKYRSLGIFSLLGSTVYHDSAVNCGTLPSEEAFLLAVLLLWRLFLGTCPFGGAAPLEAVPWDLPFWRCCSFGGRSFGSALLWCCSFCKRSPFWKYCSFERVISLLEDSFLWETISLQSPFH